ncbi:aminopeptidase N [Xylanimonas cellulosilytica DSM 15894]|uniref:Aminopeptidase N n=1 Tax=Xylanimonas cellulosilytica (strain DSM 15894 / JCM 12276 / CECT 5975 / KCTC 9989 / LMG 20990 / NBRC 107835 / XIL07) TaxID=446471 RepID=D1BZH9_XYLCX|nr:aminopeptidase N [Xylanimonas cellulosilytica]ACZ30133.1 aminopeptidase N [Xylanimonas cellulosilytica DSM 15894]
MPGQNLTRAEAIERASAVTAVESYAIALDLTTGPTTFASTTTIRFSGTPGADTFLDLVAPTVRSVTLNGVDLDPAAVFADSRIALAGLAAENEVVVVADCAYTNTGEGLHRFVDPVDGEVYLYTQFEVPDARRVFATFEQPDLKATYQVTVTAPARWEVVSNQPTPEPVPAEGTVVVVEGKEPEPTATWTFEPTPRLSTYLVALVAGPYAVVRDSLTSTDGREIPLGVFCRQSLSQYLDADYIVDITRRGFAFYEEAFEYPYPFDKYDQLFVPEYNMGAMENPGCVTFTEAYVFRGSVPDGRKERRVVTILHELAHMWFGDLVTMKWWNDLWLNESFAEFASTLATAEATEWTEGWTTFAASEKTWAYRQDALPSTHPIVAEIRDLEDVYTNFDGITYAKGASVLKQLYAWVGREQFMKGLANYFRKHEFSNTELRDLLVELEATSGRDLDAWGKAWLETAGTNTLTPSITVAADGTVESFEIHQTAPTGHPTLRPHRLGIGYYSLTASGTVERTHQVIIDVDGERTNVRELVGTKRPDLILLNDEDLAFAKVRLDADSLAFAVANLAKIDDSLARGVIWGSAWDAVRDGEAPASSFVDLVLNNVSAETESTTVTMVLAQLGTAAGIYADPAQRAAQTTRAADAVWALATAAAAGSDLQLQLVRAFAALASGPEHVAPLAGLLSGEVVLDGREIDTDLHWDLLQGLVALGAAGDAEIDAALAADDTATGRQSAARVRASKPTTADKQTAFASIVDEADVPNAIIRATAAGFRRVTDPAVIEPLVGRYLDALLPIWESRSYQMAEELIEGLYPLPVANAALRDAVQAWLDAHPDAAPSLRRMVVESLADTERALTAQAVDAPR